MPLYILFSVGALVSVVSIGTKVRLLGSHICARRKAVVQDVDEEQLSTDQKVKKLEEELREKKAARRDL